MKNLVDVLADVFFSLESLAIFVPRTSITFQVPDETAFEESYPAISVNRK